MRVVVSTRPYVAPARMTPTWPVTTRRTVRVTRAFIGGAAAQYVTRFAGATHELDYYTAARGYVPRRVGRP